MCYNIKYRTSCKGGKHMFIVPVYDGVESVKERLKVRKQQLQEIIGGGNYKKIIERAFDKENINNLNYILEQELFLEYVPSYHVEKFKKAIVEDRLDITEFTEEYIMLASWGFVGLVNELGI
ncbi:MAG: hypothetical protein ACRCTZ_13015 [Sarcina sp.]